MVSLRESDLHRIVLVSLIFLIPAILTSAIGAPRLTLRRQGVNKATPPLPHRPPLSRPAVVNQGNQQTPRPLELAIPITHATSASDLYLVITLVSKILVGKSFLRSCYCPLLPCLLFYKISLGCAFALSAPVPPTLFLSRHAPFLFLDSLTHRHKSVDVTWRTAVFWGGTRNKLNPDWSVWEIYDVEAGLSQRHFLSTLLRPPPLLPPPPSPSPYCHPPLLSIPFSQYLFLHPLPSPHHLLPPFYRTDNSKQWFFYLILLRSVHRVPSHNLQISDNQKVLSKFLLATRYVKRK